MAQGADFHNSTIIAQLLLFSTLPQPVSNMADVNRGEQTPFHVDLCCEGTVTTKYKYTGTVSIAGLGLFCDIPLAGVPNMAEAGITITMGIGIADSVNNSPGCDDGDVCISISAPVTITGGGYGSVLNGVIDVRIVGGGTGSGSFNYCIVGGFSTGEFCAKPTATFSFEFGSIAGASWTWAGEESCS